MEDDIRGTEGVTDVTVTVESCVDGSNIGRRRLKQVRVVDWVRWCPCAVAARGLSTSNQRCPDCC